MDSRTCARCLIQNITELLARSVVKASLQQTLLKFGASNLFKKSKLQHQMKSRLQNCPTLLQNSLKMIQPSSSLKFKQ